jgi:hypothetical protein
MRFIVHEPTTGTNRVWSVSGPDTIDGYTKIPKSIGHMKGDIIVFKGDGNPTVLQLGLPGQYLRVNTDTETGLEWVTR